MQEYLCVVKGQGVEFKLQKANQEQVEKYQKAFASDFEGSYEEMFHDHRAGGLLDGIYTDPDSTIEVYKGLDVDDTKPIFSINIQEVVNTVTEVIDEEFVGLCEGSRGTVGDFLINLKDDEVFSPKKLKAYISTVKTSNGDINFVTGYSYRGFEGIPEELGLEFEKGKDAELLLDGYSLELDVKDQTFVYNFANNKPQLLLSQEQLDKAARAYLKQYKEYEKPLLEAFRNNLTVEVVKKAAAYFSIARTLPGTSVKRYKHVIEALNLIHPINVNHFELIHDHLKECFGVANLPSACSKFVFLKFKSHTFPIYDSVVKRSLGLKANCSYEEFQAAFYKVFLNYQKQLKIACLKLDDDIAKQAWFQMRVLDLALWELQK